MAPDEHTSSFGCQAPLFELNIFTIIFIFVLRGCTLLLSAGNRRQLVPIWSPGLLPHTPTPGKPVAPNGHTSKYGRQAPRLKLSIFTIIFILGFEGVYSPTLRRKSASIGPDLEPWSPSPYPYPRESTFVNVQKIHKEL